MGRIGITGLLSGQILSAILWGTVNYLWLCKNTNKQPPIVVFQFCFNLKLLAHIPIKVLALAAPGPLRCPDPYKQYRKKSDLVLAIWTADQAVRGRDAFHDARHGMGDSQRSQKSTKTHKTSKSVCWGKTKFQYLRVQVYILGPVELNTEVHVGGSWHEEFRTWRK